MPKIKDGGWLTPANDETDISIGFTTSPKDEVNEDDTKELESKLELDI